MVAFSNMNRCFFLYLALVRTVLSHSGSSIFSHWWCRPDNHCIAMSTGRDLGTSCSRSLKRNRPRHWFAFSLTGGGCLPRGSSHCARGGHWCSKHHTFPPGSSTGPGTASNFSRFNSFLRVILGFHERTTHLSVWIGLRSARQPLSPRKPLKLVWFASTIHSKNLGPGVGDEDVVFYAHSHPSKSWCHFCVAFRDVYACKLSHSCYICSLSLPK